MSEISTVVLSTLEKLGGVAALVAGFAGFLKASAVARQQALQEKELEIVKAQNQRALFAHSLQFKKEFDTYLELWPLLVPLQGMVNSVLAPSPAQDAVDPDGSKREAVLQRLFDQTGKILDFVHTNRPFIHIDVFRRLDSFGTGAAHTWMNAKYRALAKLGEPGADDFRSLEDTEKRVADIADAIRRRVGLANEGDLLS